MFALSVTGLVMTAVMTVLQRFCDEHSRSRCQAEKLCLPITTRFAYLGIHANNIILLALLAPNSDYADDEYAKMCFPTHPIDFDNTRYIEQLFLT